jgi:hypothetical protein
VSRRRASAKRFFSLRAQGISREPGEHAERHGAGNTCDERDRNPSRARRAHRFERREGALEARIAERVEQNEVFFGNGAATEFFA